jgi:hypothetical protein
MSKIHSQHSIWVFLPPPFLFFRAIPPGAFVFFAFLGALDFLAAFGPFVFFTPLGALDLGGPFAPFRSRTTSAACPRSALREVAVTSLRFPSSRSTIPLSARAGPKSATQSSKAKRVKMTGRNIFVLDPTSKLCVLSLTLKLPREESVPTFNG